MKTIYTAHATTVAGRDGHTQTDDNKLSIKLARPGSSETGSNPEQLFACGYSACFGSAINAIAKKNNITVKEIKVDAEVSLNQSDEGKFFLSAKLNALLPDIDQSDAENLVKDAHQLCPYSQAIKNNVDVKLSANNQEIS